MIVLSVDVVEGVWKGDCDLCFVVDEVYDTSSRLPGSKVLNYLSVIWGALQPLYQIESSVKSTL